MKEPPEVQEHITLEMVKTLQQGRGLQWQNLSMASRAKGFPIEFWPVYHKYAFFSHILSFLNFNTCPCIK